MKKVFLLTSATVLVVSVSAFGFLALTQVQKTPSENLSVFEISDIPKTNEPLAGTTQKTNPDGSTTTYYPDGSTQQTPVNGGTSGMVITGPDYTGTAGTNIPPGSTGADGTIRTETYPTVIAPPPGSSNPISKNDTVGPDGFPIGSGYTPNNGTGIQNPNTPTGAFPTGSGYTSPNYNQLNSSSIQSPAIVAPTSIPFLDRFIPPSLFGKNGPLNTIFNQLFYLGLLIAVVLAVVMIVRGGVEYMTVDAVASKDSGKKRVQAALGGLLLAFSAILILNTVNPALTKLNIVFPSLSKVSSIEIEADIENSVNQYLGLTDAQYAEFLASGKIPTDVSPAAQKILAEALGSVGTLKTGTIDNTNGGRLACAAAVNKIVSQATGQPVGGGLSTAAMYTALQSNSKFVLVPGGTQNALPGDIIISPSSGSATGLVGIVATNGAGQIISNSSSQRQVLQNHTSNSWNNYYGKKGLPVYIYRPK